MIGDWELGLSILIGDWGLGIRNWVLYWGLGLGIGEIIEIRIRIKTRL